MKPLSRIQECDTCGDVELTNQAILPDGWVQLWDSPAILCNKCITKWVDKWGEPAIWLTGGEKELKFNEDGSVSKDSTPGRQTDFNFV